jgi:hypothetical protein
MKETEDNTAPFAIGKLGMAGGKLSRLVHAYQASA